MPTELDEISRRIRMLEIEEEALKKDDAEQSVERLSEIGHCKRVPFSFVLLLVLLRRDLDPGKCFGNNIRAAVRVAQRNLTVLRKHIRLLRIIDLHRRPLQLCGNRAAFRALFLTARYEFSALRALPEQHL